MAVLIGAVLMVAFLCTILAVSNRSATAEAAAFEKAFVDNDWADYEKSCQADDDERNLPIWKIVYSEAGSDTCEDTGFENLTWNEAFSMSLDLSRDTDDLFTGYFPQRQPRTVPPQYAHSKFTLR